MGKPSGKQWIAPPAGTFVSFTLDRAVTKITAEGSKFAQDFAMGQVSGSFSWSFYADYDHIEPFYLAFEDYQCQTLENGLYQHSFAKVNNKKIKSFTMRVKQLNRISGGYAGDDEVTELRGCFVKSVKFSSSAGTSQVQVSMSGAFADARTWVGDLMTTDYTEYDGELWEFTCLFFGTDANNDSYVDLVDSLSVSVDNNAEMLYSVCSAFANSYYEGTANFSLSASCYSNDPERFRLRSYTGGQSVATGSPVSPWAKGLEPCADMMIYSYNLSVHDGDAEDIGTAIKESTRTAAFHVEDCVFKSTQWPAGDGSKLQEQLSSAECRKISLTIKSDIPNLENTNSHPVNSPDPS